MHHEWRVKAIQELFFSLSHIMEEERLYQHKNMVTPKLKVHLKNCVSFTDNQVMTLTFTRSF